jgi:hypothetical protein
MALKYSILHIDDSRKESMDYIRSVVNPAGYDEVEVVGVDGRLENVLSPFPDHNSSMSSTERAIWHTMVNAWKKCVELDEPLLVFEDDAIPEPDFVDLFDWYREALPEGWDVLSLFVGQEQYNDFKVEVLQRDQWGGDLRTGSVYDFGAPEYLIGSDRICRVYNGYSCVAMYYSPRGAARLLKLAETRGCYTVVDCFLYMQSKLGMLDSYTYIPGMPRPVGYDWNKKSLRTGGNN